MTRSRALLALVATTLLGVSSVALGLPWDIDMADSVAVKAYEREMKAPVAGTVSQPSLTTPKAYVPNFVRGSAEGNALTNPLPADEATLATGKQMYGYYCAPCHGTDGVNLGPVAQPGRLPGVVPLAGGAGVAKLRNDGWIYLTIRNGGAVMPSYSWAMTDAEMWSIVSYVRTLEGAKFVPQEAP